MKRSPMKRIGKVGKRKLAAMNAARKLYASNGWCHCQFCGKEEVGLDMHHIKFRSQGGKDTADNLVALCREHHSLVHLSMTHRQALKVSGATIENGWKVK